MSRDDLTPADRTTLRNFARARRVHDAGMFARDAGQRSHFRRLERLGLIEFDAMGRDMDREVDRDVALYNAKDAVDRMAQALRAAEHLLADSQRLLSDRDEWLRSIVRAVGAKDTGGAQSMEGTESRTYRDAVRRVEAMAMKLSALESSEEYDDELGALIDVIAEHLPTYAGDHEGENADAIDTVIAAGDELKRARARLAKIDPLIEAVRDARDRFSRADAVSALLAATSKEQG